MEKKKPKSVKAIVDKLHDVFDELRAGTIDNKSAETLANIGGKVINGAKARLEYKAFNGSIGKVEELEDQYMSNNEFPKKLPSGERVVSLRDLGKIIKKVNKMNLISIFTTSEDEIFININHLVSIEPFGPNSVVRMANGTMYEVSEAAEELYERIINMIKG